MQDLETVRTQRFFVEFVKILQTMMTVVILQNMSIQSAPEH